MPRRGGGGGKRGGISKVYRNTAAIVAKRMAGGKQKTNVSPRGAKAKRDYNIATTDDDDDEEDEEPKVVIARKEMWNRIKVFSEELRADKSCITISSKKLLSEAKLKSDRSARVSAGWRFVLFFALYAAVMIIQKNAGQNQQINSAIADYFVNSQFRDVTNTIGTDWPDRLGPGMEATGCFSDDCTQPTYLTKGFLDILDTDDFWEWMQNHFLDLLYTVTTQMHTFKYTDICIYTRTYKYIDLVCTVTFLVRNASSWVSLTCGGRITQLPPRSRRCSFTRRERKPTEHPFGDGASPGARWQPGLSRGIHHKRVKGRHP